MTQQITQLQGGNIFIAEFDILMAIYGSQEELINLIFPV